MQHRSFDTCLVRVAIGKLQGACPMNCSKVAPLTHQGPGEFESSLVGVLLAAHTQPQPKLLPQLQPQASGLKPLRLQASSLRPQASGLKLLQASGLRPQAPGLRPQASGFGFQASGLRPQAPGFRPQAPGNMCSRGGVLTAVS